MNRKRFGDCLNALSSLGILLANSAMTVLVVLFGASFCKYSYLFSLTLSIYGAVFFYVLFVILDQRWNPLVPLQDFQRREMFGVLHRQGALTGVAWSVNYVLVTAANPFVPGLLLLVLHSSGMAFLVFLSVLLLENSYCLAQWGCIALVCAGRSLAMLDESVDDRRGIWALVYGLGVWAVGVANLLTENVMRNVRRVCEGDEETRQPLISVVQFLCVVKLYSIPATLALCWIPRAARGPARARYRADGMKCLWTGACAEADSASCAEPGSTVTGLVSMWIASTLSFVTVFLAAGVQRQRDAVYVGIAHALGPVLSMVVLIQRGLMGIYYRQPQRIQVLSNVITLGGGVVYTAVTLLQEKRAPRTTCLSRSFRFEPLGEALDPCMDPAALPKSLELNR
uniref:EamA domain-containing protein n=1 Tax=Alexandrium monilatum TaxID=311494 RepID=A0A7S4Q6F0_9DINO